MWARKMRDSLVQQLLNRTGPVLGERTSAIQVLTDRYTKSDDIALVRNAPQLACLTEDLPKNHAIATQSGHVVVRKNDGGLACFENRCMHRGAELLEPGKPPKKLNASVLLCPYHSWSYNCISGALCKAPSIEKSGISLSSLQDISLKSTFVYEKWGAIWTSSTKFNWEDSNEATAVIDECFLQMETKPSLISDTTTTSNEKSFTFKPKTIDSQTILVQANWKLCIETFLESDHVGTLHKNTIGQVTAGLEDRVSVILPLDKQNQVIIVPLTKINLKDSKQHLAACATILVFAFPHIAIVMNPNFVAYLSHRPINARQTELSFLATARIGVCDEIAKRDFRNILIGAQEDYDCVTGIQRGIDRAVAAEEELKFLFSPLERGLARFNKAVDSAVTTMKF